MFHYVYFKHSHRSLLTQASHLYIVLSFRLPPVAYSFLNVLSFLPCASSISVPFCPHSSFILAILSSFPSDSPFLYPPLLLLLSFSSASFLPSLSTSPFLHCLLTPLFHPLSLTLTLSSSFFVR